MALTDKVKNYSTRAGEETAKLQKLMKCASSDLSYGDYTTKEIVDYAADGTVPASNGIVYNWNACGDLAAWDNENRSANWTALQGIIAALQAGTVILATYSGTVLVRLCLNKKGEVCYVNPDTLRWVTCTDGIMHSDEEEPKDVPVSTILPYNGTVIIPDGYLLCNGANVSRAQYADLFAAIGTTFGEGDGSTTFTLPNMSNRFCEGASAVSYVSAGIPNYSGYVQNMVWDDGANYYGQSGALYLTAGNRTRSWTGANGDGMKALWVNAAWSNSLYGASSTIQPVALKCLMLIKY